MGCRTADASIEVNAKLPDHGEILDDPSKYRRLVGKLNYLTVTRPNIAFVVSVEVSFSQRQKQPLGCSSAEFQILKESSRKKASVFGLWTH